MKINTKKLTFLLSGIILTGISFVTMYKNNSESTTQETVKKCECGPTEHWFYKACVKNYNKQFPEAKLEEDFDTEGLSENILQAIDRFSIDIQFVDENNIPLELELNTKGNSYLPLFKNPDFKLYKQVLKTVDETTTLSAQELYQQWSIQLNELK